MALVRERAPVRRPVDYDARLQETLRALRYLRIDDNGAFSLLASDQDAGRSGSAPIYPSIAVLQLYLLNDTAFKAKYIEEPLKFTRPGLVDVRGSNNSAAAMLKSLVAASREVGDIRPSETAAVLRRAPLLQRDYPNIYMILRTAVLQRLDALRRTVLNNDMLDYVYRQRWQAQAPTLALLNRLEAALRDWRARAATMRESESNERAAGIADEVVQEVYPLLITEARNATAVAAGLTQPVVEPVIVRQPPPRPVVVKPEPPPPPRPAEPVEEEEEEEEEEEALPDIDVNVPF